jgi:predicted RNase H-like nuclease (RuvC/YqgF family)
MSFSEFIGEREREIKAEVNRLKQENKALKKQIPTKKRIIEVLNKYLTNEMYTEDVNIKGIANEILGDGKNG